MLDEAPSLDEFSFNPVPVEDVLREDEVGRDIDPEKLTDQWRPTMVVRGPKLS